MQLQEQILELGGKEILCITFNLGGQGTNTYMTINAGNIGIGTDTPDGIFHVNGAAFFGDTDSNIGDLRLYDTGNNLLNFKANGSNSFVIDLEGTSATGDLGITQFDVGIGTIDPSGKLEISGASSSDYTPLIFGEDGSDTYKIDAKFSGTGASGNWIELNDYWGNNNMTWRGGDVGIGTTSPEASLHIISPSNGSNSFGNGITMGKSTGGDYQIQITSVSGLPHLDFANAANEDYDARFLLNDNNTLTLAGANFGIHTYTPSVALDVTGDIEYTGTITDVSDLRSKENIQEIQGSEALTILTNIQAKSFNMIDVPNRREYGYIAQEVQEIFPDAVSIIDPETEYLGLNYMSFIPLATESIKELNNKIQELSSLSATSTGSTITTVDVRQELTSLGLVVSDTGVLEVKEIEADLGRFKKIEMEDEDTGEIYCVRLSNGDFIKEKGLCNQQASVVETIPDPVVEVPSVENSTTTEEQATTTEEVQTSVDNSEETEEEENDIIEDNSTTTEPVVEEQETPVEAEEIVVEETEEISEEGSEEPVVEEEIIEEQPEEVIEEDITSSSN
jgi:hypothetical protein